MADLTAPAYVKYELNRIVELVCRGCVTETESDTVAATPAGILPIKQPGTVICERCKQVAT